MPQKSADDVTDPDAPRFPPDVQFVTLSDALSWIAFRRSMNGVELGNWVGMGRPPSDANVEIDEALKEAVDRLTDLASGDKIEIRGRFYSSVLADDRDIQIQTISGEALSNYRQFDTPDILWRGRELAWAHDRQDLPAVTADHYRDVTVKREDLMRYFDQASKAGKPGRRRGRTPGSGSYLAADKKLFPEMAAMIAEGNALTPQQAARKIAHKAIGGGGEESKVTRLAKNYRSENPESDS